MNRHVNVWVNKITPRFGFGWTKYRGDGSLVVVHFDFYKRSLSVHIDLAPDSAMG